MGESVVVFSHTPASSSHAVLALTDIIQPVSKHFNNLKDRLRLVVISDHTLQSKTQIFESTFQINEFLRVLY